MILLLYFVILKLPVTEKLSKIMMLFNDAWAIAEYLSAHSHLQVSTQFPTITFSKVKKSGNAVNKNSKMCCNTNVVVRRQSKENKNTQRKNSFCDKKSVGNCVRNSVRLWY